MQSTITQLKIAGFYRRTLLVFAIFCLLLGSTNAQTLVNGNLSTGATAENGTPAPAGTTWSEVQHNTGDMTVSNNTIGSGATGANSIADDFTITAGQTWSLGTFTTYGYSTGYTGTTSPFTQLFVRIHSGNPLLGPTTIVFGDLTTNRMSATANANMYRISNTLVPAPLATGTTRRIWSITANVNVTLPAGTYWIEYRMTAGTLGNFAPHSTPLGVRAAPGSNAIQNLGGTWSALTDIGFPASGPDVAVDMPWTLTYVVAGACTGTPDAGNSIANPTAVCPGFSFSVSLQNNPPVSGLTYQWQSSASATGPFTNITGATSSTYSSTTLAASTYYQAIVSCGANSDTSNPVLVTLNTPSQCYCTPPTTNCNLDDEILNVTFGSSLNNSSSTCSATGYTNYTTTVDTTDIIRGAANAMSVRVGPGGTEHVAVWIDYNQNGIFEATEFTALGSGNGTTINGTINVPATALLGATRMRVRVRFATALTGTQACAGGFTFGETEDYLVNIVPCVQGVINTQPVNRTIGCSGSTTFSVAATGSLLNYQWEYRTGATGPWLLVPNTAPFSGANTNTLTLSNTPSTFNNYQFRVVISGACTATDFSNTATLTVGRLVATTNVASGNICLGSLQQLSITNTAPPVTQVFTSTPNPLNLIVPDLNGPPVVTAAVANAGANHTIPVTIPTGAIIANMRVRLNITHPYVADLVIVLRAPNGQILNLSYHKGGTGSAGANFTNVVFSSAAGLPTVNSGAAPGYTGTYRPDASIGAGTFADPSGSGPTGFAPTVTTFAGLYSVPSGNWTIALADPSTWAGDQGTLTNWSLEFDYGAPSTGIFTGPNIFTDPAGTVPYNGTTPISTVYVNPTTTTTYGLVVTNPLCVSDTLRIPVTVSTRITGVTTPATTRTCRDENSSITVTSATGNLQTVQWQVSTGAGNPFTNVTNAGVFSGATTNMLNITGAPDSISGYRFRAIVSNPCNRDTSTISTLTVNPNPVIVISANPFTALTPGMTTTLSAAVSPNPGATYQWFRNGVAVPGATSSTLVVDVDALGEYTVSVTDINTCTSLSNMIAIRDSASDIVFIYPSPTTGQFQVRYQSSTGNTTLARMLNVYDSKGARVYSRSFSISAPYERMDVDLSQHGKGIYQVELSDVNGRRLKTGRVLVL